MLPCFAAAVAAATSTQPAIAQAPADDPTAWKSSAAFGLTMTRGNSETVMGTLNLSTGKKWDQHEISLGADAAYGTTEIDGEEETTASSARAFGQYNHLFNERLYGYGRLEALHDDVANVDYRITLSPGAGYYLIKEDRMDLSVEAGPSYVLERLDGEEDNYLALRLAEKFNFKINDRARIWQSVEFLPQVDDFDNFLLNAEIGIEADLTESFSLRSFIQDTYDNEPAPGRDENDLKWVTAIAYKF